VARPAGQADQREKGLLRQKLDYYLRHLDRDIPAGIVVFLVALPLCLGIAVASGASPFSGVIAGIVGGMIVAIGSGSQLSVSGPAAGLTVIVAGAIEKIGFDGLLLAIVLAGLAQIVMGYLRAGVIGAYFPSAVIKGMLAAIGLILIMKQLPHAVGYDADAESDLSFLEDDSHTPFSALLVSFNSFSIGATLVSLVSIGIILFWDSTRIRSSRYLSILPGPLVAVVFGVVFNYLAGALFPAFEIQQQHLVSLPEIFGPIDFAHQLHFPA